MMLDGSAGRNPFDRIEKSSDFFPGEKALSRAETILLKLVH
jgi:hypothetical protein